LDVLILLGDMADSVYLDSLKDLLVSGDFLKKEELSIVEAMVKSKGGTFEEAVISKGYLSDKELSVLIAEISDWNFVALGEMFIDGEILRLVPLEMAKKLKVIAFGKGDDGIKIAMNNPNDIITIHLLRKKLDKVDIYYASVGDIDNQLSSYKDSIAEEFASIIAAANDEMKKDEGRESDAVQIVDLLIMRGYEEKASDIHIEPQEAQTSIRFRIDGVMREILVLPKKFHDSLISRIKVMAHLRTDEHQIPQDGKLRYLIDDETIDIRVSSVPTTKGENVVMRILGEKAHQYTLIDLGLEQVDLEKVKRAIKKPWGMILSAGPTGSGKTTSLYAVLKILNQKNVSIATIEDPVEYNVDGITQIQVNNMADLTFASGLRSIVRQDPNIIMVGEIRDAETADIAVNSALTGHLVLSTLHTNDAPTSIPRLLDMGVDPFLIVSTINIVIAQRLLRKICLKCIQSVESPIEKMKENYPANIVDKLADGKDQVIIYQGVGCKFCGHSGFHGRTGVFEVMEVDDEMKKLIMKNVDAGELKRYAVEHGMRTMFDDASQKVLSGLTTIEEMMRVVKV